MVRHVTARIRVASKAYRILHSHDQGLRSPAGDFASRELLGRTDMSCTRIGLYAAALLALHFSTAASAQSGPVFGEVTFGEVMVRAAASKILENKTKALAIFNKREEGNF